ncbi:unnamed protein product [Moneuplotes crassus]|uniref:Uncharacterized protein n=1 Tax=Euplotes crassus TaxID=5936 RepID=A0AAD2DBF0_EUPCR|nr:unnamed protein product [Moneuplotes crassus]
MLKTPIHCSSTPPYTPTSHLHPLKTLPKLPACSMTYLALISLLFLLKGTLQAGCDLKGEKKACERDMISLSASDQFEVSDIQKINSNFYIMMKNSDKDATLFCKYNGSDTEFCWNEQDSGEAMVVMSDEQRVVFSADGLQSNPFGIAFQIYSLDGAGNINRAIYHKHTSADLIEESVPYMEEINSTHIISYSNTKTSNPYLLILDITTGYTLRYEWDAQHTFAQVAYSKTLSTTVVMYQLRDTKGVYFRGFDWQSHALFSEIGISCPNAGGTGCSYGLNSAKTMNDEQTMTYFLFYYEPYGMLFMSFDISSTGSSTTFAPSVDAEDNYHLSYHDKLVYLMFQAKDGKFILSRFNTSTEEFSNEVYQTSIYYKKSFIVQIMVEETTVYKQFAIGSSGRNIAVAYCDIDIFKNHGDFQDSKVTIAKSEPKILTQGSSSVSTSSPSTTPASYFSQILTPSPMVKVQTEKNPQSDDHYFYGPVLFENEPKLTISKVLNQTTDFCINYPQTNDTEFSYKFDYGSKETSDALKLDYDESTKSLSVYMQEVTLLKKTHNITIYSIPDNANGNYTQTVEITEEIDSEDRKVYEAIQGSVAVVGAIASVLGGILGGTLIQALWMVFNQQKILLFFVMIDTYMHVFVRLIISKQNFGLLDFGFLSELLPDSIDSPSFIQNFDQKQRKDIMVEIGFEKESFLNTYWIYIQIVLAFIFFHLLSLLLLKLFPKIFINNPPNPPIPHQDSTVQNPSSHKTPLFTKPHQKSQNSTTANPNQIHLTLFEETKTPAKSTLSHPTNRQTSQSHPKTTHYTQRSPQNPPFSRKKKISRRDSTRNRDYENRKEFEEDKEESGESEEEGDSRCRRVCYWIGGKMKSNNFWSVYVRLVLESFLGIMLITTNEIKTNKLVETSHIVSYVISWIAAILYAAFYVFVCVIGVYEVRRRIKIRYLYQELDEDSQQKELCKGYENKFYAELFKDLSNKPYAALHQAFNLTRTVFIIVVVYIDVFDKSTVWVLYFIMMVLQFLYIYQAIVIPKFEDFILRIIYLLNEYFLLLFIITFGLLKSSEDWKYDITMNIVITMIFVNSIIVIGFQILGNILQGKQSCQWVKKLNCCKSTPPPIPSEQDIPVEIPLEMANSYQSSSLSPRNSPPTPLAKREENLSNLHIIKKQTLNFKGGL